MRAPIILFHVYLIRVLGAALRQMNKDIESVLVDETEIDRIITRLAKEIDRDYSSPDKRLVLVSILKGSVMFTGALMGELKTNAEI